MSGDTISKCDDLDIWGIITSPHNILKLCTAFCILLANTILITLILKSKKLREQRFQRFIISLALADILVGLVIPFMVLTAREDTWGLGVHFCKLVTSVQKVSLAVSTYSFLAINVDRLMAMKLPWIYRDWQRNKIWMKRQIVSCWLLGLLPALPMWIDPEGHYLEDLDTCSCHFPYAYTFWIWWNGITAFLLPGSALLVVSILITRHMTALITDGASSVRGRMNYAKERKITIMMATITIVFFICVAPYFIFFLCPGNQDFKESYLPLIVMVMYLNSLINPLLYMAVNSDIRTEVIGWICCRQQPTDPRGSHMSLGRLRGSELTLSSH